MKDTEDSNIDKIKKEFNYSKVGKSSIKKYSYIMDKNKGSNEQILKYKNRKKLLDEFVQNNISRVQNPDDLEAFSLNVDIFSKTYKHKILSKSLNKKKLKDSKEFSVKSSCSYVNRRKKIKYNLFQIRNNIINNKVDKSFNKYKYHLLHHNEEFNEMLVRQKPTPSCTQYNPKIDYTCRKSVYSIPFKKMTGRREIILKEKEEMVKENSLPKDINKNKTFQLKDNKANTARNTIKIYKNETFIPGAIVMKYQLSRQPLPIHNDFRIRNINYNANFRNFSLNDKIYKNNNDQMSRTQLSFKISKPQFKPILSNSFNSINEPQNNKFMQSSSSSNNLNKKGIKYIKKITGHKEENEKKHKDNKNQKNKNIDIIKEEQSMNDGKKIEKNQEEEKRKDKILIKGNILKEDINYGNHKNMTDYLDFLNQKKMAENDKATKKSSNNATSLINDSGLLFDESDKKKYKAINFEKMLSRKYLEKINKVDEHRHPLIIPNYSIVEPKTIMKVHYAKQIYNKKPERFNGVKSDFAYDINKIFYKYNNHTSPIVCNFNKFTGRKIIDGKGLPLFMTGLTDRSSINSFNENSFKMNNYSNGGLHGTKSSFNEKKSHNIRLQFEELKKDGNMDIVNFKKSMDNNTIKKLLYQNMKIKNNEDKYKTKEDNYNENSKLNRTLKKHHWKQLLGEYYRINFDDLDKTHYSFIGTKVDGITFKNYNTKDKFPNLLTKKEKEMFLCYK